MCSDTPKFDSDEYFAVDPAFERILHWGWLVEPVPYLIKSNF